MAENSGDLSLGYMMGQSEGNGGFGGGWGEGIWAVIILAILFGRGGFGGGFGGNDCCGCATQADVRAAVDQQTLISKLDQQTYGLADATYALNNTIVNGFHGVDNAVCTTNYNMQNGFNNLSHQISDCCCATQRTIADSARDIIDNQNCNYRGIMDFLVQSKIDTLQSENEALRLSASQAKQNQYLIDQLRPCPVPAYITCNPYSASWGYGNNGCGCGC